MQISVQDNLALKVKDQDDKKLNLFIKNVKFSFSVSLFALLKTAGWIIFVVNYEGLSLYAGSLPMQLIVDLLTGYKYKLISCIWIENYKTCIDLLMMVDPLMYPAVLEG